MIVLGSGVEGDDGLAIVGAGGFGVDWLGGDGICEANWGSFAAVEEFAFELTSDSGIGDGSAALGTVERRA